MNGAQALIRTLVGAGVDVCFGNPGTSEMHFVAALDSVPEMRAVLALSEGVVAGAADGYGRIADRPAATLFHLGPGMGNGMANLHNARRARTPIVNVVGDHATYHKRFDAPLESDIEGLAATLEGWIRRSEATGAVGKDAAETVAAAMEPPGRIATLILPADVSWSEGGEVADAVAPAARSSVADAAVEEAAAALRSGEPTVILIGGVAARADGVAAAVRAADATGSRVFCETFPARLERGAGRAPVERLAYLAEMVSAQLEGVRHLVLAGARAPVSFFAYPDTASDLVPEGCEVHTLSEAGDDAIGALEALADAVGAPAEVRRADASRPALPRGELNVQTAAEVIGATLPEAAIVADESNTSGLLLPMATAGAPPHDWLTLTGGAIGIGIPLAVGAAVAAPDRPVLCLESDGSAMYHLGGLWSMAREELDVTTVIFSNRSYAILNLELQRVGAEAAGPKAKQLLDLSSPDLDFVRLAEGMGVPASRATSCEELTEQLERAHAEPGPHLIEAQVAPIV